MRARAPVLLLAWLVAGGGARAADFQQEVQSAWEGAWVVTRTELSSDCVDAAYFTDPIRPYTVNRFDVAGTRTSQGARHFAAGELGKIEKIAVRRSFVELLVDLTEPVLLEVSQRPVTVYKERQCKVGLSLKVPRAVIKGRDVETLSQLLGRTLERHGSEAEARASESWNGRHETYPDDYETTVQRFRDWASEWFEKEGRSLAVSSALRSLPPDTEDEEALEDFARGFEGIRRVELSCEELVAQPVDLPPELITDPGELRGRRFGLALQRLARLPQCLSPAAEAKQPAPP